jgi:protein lifeguard
MYFRPPPKGPEWYASDAETGQAARPLYPMMLEDPRLRWAFIRKVYSILSIQMLLTVAVAAVVVYVRPVALFFVSTPGGFGLYIFLLILPFIGTRRDASKALARSIRFGFLIDADVRHKRTEWN